MAKDDPPCGICDELYSAHVVTSGGPLTCPRVARGEGHYVLERPGYTMSGAMGSSYFGIGDDIEMPPVYKFVPKKEPEFIWGWRPGDVR
jgi:hypothetical protein